MADVKFSQFANGGNLTNGDVVVGLRGGVNTKFNSPADPLGPFLLKANNLSDVASKMDSFQNLGFGDGQLAFLTDADFPGGIHILTNPCPNFVQIQLTTPGAYTLRLPPSQGTTAFQISQGPIIRVTRASGVTIQLQDSIGTVLGNLLTPSGTHLYLSDNSTPQGTWLALPNVFTISTNDGDSGDLTLRDSFENVYIDALTGLDISNFGQGSIFQPYASLSFAIAHITDASSSKPYKIIMNTGNYTDTNVALKPWIFVDGNQSILNITGSVTLDASWSTGGYLFFNNFFNLSWPSTVTLDFNAVNSPFSVFTFSNNISSGSTTVNITGQNTNGAILLIENDVDFSSVWNFNITNCYGAIQGGDVGNTVINHTSETAGGNFSLFNLTNIGTTTVTDSTNAGMILFNENANMIGDTLYQSNGTGTLNVLEKGVSHSGDLTLDNGTGGGNVNLSANTLTFLPTLLNGATYNPDTIADAVRANAYFAPSNFTPTSGAPGQWTASSVTGYFAGIDAALAVADNIPAAFGEMYFQGNVTPTTIVTPGVPVKVNATYNSGSLQGFSQSGGTLTYTGTGSRDVYVSADLTATYAGTSQNTSFYIALDGAVVAKSQQSTFIGAVTPANQTNPCQCIVPIVNGSQLELWVSNDDNTNNPIVTDCNFVVQSVSAVGVTPPRQVTVLGNSVIPTGNYVSGFTTSVWQTFSGTNVVRAHSLAVGQTVEMTVTGVLSAINAGGGVGFIQFNFGSLISVNSQNITLTGTYQSPIEFRVRITRAASNTIVASTCGYYNDNSLVSQVLRMVIDPYSIAYDETVDNALTLTWSPIFTGSNAFNFIAANLNIIQYN